MGGGSPDGRWTSTRRAWPRCRRNWPRRTRWGSAACRHCNGGRRDELEIYPNLWAGYGLVRGGAGTALVGSHEEVAERLEEYHAVGIDHAILSGQPHLEEAYWFGEGAGALLRQRGLVTDPSVPSVPA